VTGRHKDLTKAQARLIAYADKLLEALTTESPPSPVAGENSGSLVHSPGLVEPLTARELEVLQLIAEGLSNLAIAQKLFLSTGSVKVHFKHIYGKLEVNSRTQAIARLRELNQ
jgi:ATP/maltotriose-dependent transcriptional regulator MalT